MLQLAMFYRCNRSFLQSYSYLLYSHLNITKIQQFTIQQWPQLDKWAHNDPYRQKQQLQQFLPYFLSHEALIRFLHSSHIDLLKNFTSMAGKAHTCKLCPLIINCFLGAAQLLWVAVVTLHGHLIYFLSFFLV